MAHQTTTNITCSLTVLLFCISLFYCYQGKAQIGTGSTSTGTVSGAITGAGTGIGTGSSTPSGEVSGSDTDSRNPYGAHSENEDPADIVAEALLCFDAKYTYSSCEESYRLTASGEINVPHDHVNEYCDGPCLTETHLLLSCVEHTMLNFKFYNQATVKDVRDTVKGGCGHDSKRGNFNVAEHIQAHESSASNSITAIQILLGIGCLTLGHALLL